MALPTATVTEQYPPRGLVVNADGSTTGTRVFNVDYPADTLHACTEAEKDEIDSHVLTQTGVDRWDSYPGIASLLATTAAVANRGSLFQWTATYTYSDRFDGSQATTAAEINGDEDGFEIPESPSPSAGDRATEAEARPYQIRSIKRTVQEVLQFDAETGHELTNSAGDKYDPPPMTERTYLGYEVTWYRYPANLRWAAPPVNPPLGRPDYLDTVNDAAFKVFGRTHSAGTLRVSDVSVSLQWDKGDGGALTPVCELRAEVLHKPGGWKRVILDAGLRELNGDGQPLKPILDSAGQPVTDPFPLNGSGAKLTAGGALNYIECAEYPERNLIELFQ